MGRRGYPPEFRRRAVDLVESGRKVADVARDLGVTEQSIYTWRRQDRIDRGLEPGASTAEQAELAAARRRIRELETELGVARRAVELLKGAARPKRRFAAIKVMAAEGLPVEVCCRVLGVSVSGYYRWLIARPSEREIRHAWLTDVIRQVHADSRGTYGSRRVHAELTLGHGLTVGYQQVSLLMRRAGLQGLSGRPRWRRAPNLPTASDLVDRQFARPRATRRAVGDRHHRHPTREGKVYCAVVLDAWSRRVVGWSIDSTATATLVTNALGMAIDQRRPAPGATVIHSDQGTQFTSWAFTRRAVESGLLPSMGSIGDCYDNAVIESFWSRMQVELLDRRRWKTRIELANAVFDYIEIFYNRQRRHSALGMRTPVEFENAPSEPITAA